MTDEELLERLLSVPADGNGIEDVCGYAADRIQELMLDVAGWISNAQAAHDYQCEAECKLEAAEAKLAKAIDALRLVTDACDEGQMVSLGTSGMTIDAQIRRSVYNKVPAWPIEEARVVLEELDNK